jgi:hypothetical protein
MVRKMMDRWLVVMCVVALCGCASGELDGEGEGSPDQGVNRPDQGGNNQPDQSTNLPDLGVIEDDQGVPTTCSPLAQDCPSGFKCVLDGQSNALCLATGTDRAAGSECDGIHQCARGTLCVVWGDATTGRCETVCDKAASPSTCPLNGICNSGVAGRDDFGLCTSSPDTACSLVAQDCAGGQDCVWRKDANSGQSVARCGKAGALGEGATCGTGMGNCGKGMLCLAINGGSAQCARACTPGASPSGCTNGGTCSGDTGLGVSYCVR